MRKYSKCKKNNAKISRKNKAKIYFAKKWKLCEKTLKFCENYIVMVECMYCGRTDRNLKSKGREIINMTIIKL